MLIETMNKIQNTEGHRRQNPEVHLAEQSIHKTRHQNPEICSEEQSSEYVGLLNTV